MWSVRGVCAGCGLVAPADPGVFLCLGVPPRLRMEELSEPDARSGKFVLTLWWNWPSTQKTRRWFLPFNTIAVTLPRHKVCKCPLMLHYQNKLRQLRIKYLKCHCNIYILLSFTFLCTPYPSRRPHANAKTFLVILTSPEEIRGSAGPWLKLLLPSCRLRWDDCEEADAEPYEVVSFCPLLFTSQVCPHSEVSPLVVTTSVLLWNILKTR